MKPTLTAFVLACLLIPQSVSAKWIYSRETGLYNPKYAVKKTAEEQFHYAQGYFEKGDYSRARKLFKRLIQFFPDSKHTSEAQFMIAECRFADKQYYRAFLEYRSLVNEYPKNQHLQDVISRVYEIGHLFCNGAKRWWGPFHVRAYDKGILAMETVLKLDAWNPKADDAVFEIGLTHFKSYQFEDARAAFDRLLQDYPSSELASRAQYLKALCSYRQIQGPEYDPTLAKTARRDFEVLRDEFPDSQEAREADSKIKQMESESARSDYEIARFYLKNYKYRAAVVYFKSLARQYPDTPYGKKAKTVLSAVDDLETETP